VIVGSPAVATVKSVELVAVPAGVVTRIRPVLALDGTVVVICVPAVFVLKLATATLLNVTDVAPPRLAPLTVTGVPTGPEVGVNEVIVGAQPPGLATVKVELVAVPSAFTTWIGPVVALAGTVARISVLVTEPTAAGTRLKSTPLTSGFVKFVPKIVTTQPEGPLVGVNEVMVGAEATAGPAVVTSTRVVLMASPTTPGQPSRCGWVMDPLLPFRGL